MSRDASAPPAEETYVERGLRHRLREALDDTPVVCLLGPRQSGKSTLVSRIEPERVFISLDDAAYLKLAQEDPQGLLAEMPERVTIDEVQRAPALTLAIKRSVDANRTSGRFLLTGSANLLQLPRLADSLAGRMEVLQLHPFTESEKEAADGAFLSTLLSNQIEVELTGVQQPRVSSLQERLIRGGYPETRWRKLPRAQNWLRQYLRSIIERDIKDVAAVKDGSDLARLMELLSERTGTLLNITELSAALGRARQTIENHLAILEKLFLIRRLPAWSQNATKRAIKAPKVHVFDSGLACALSFLTEAEWLTSRPHFGRVLESFVVQQLIAQADWSEPELRFWHYRDKDQNEADCVVTKGRKLWGVEVKLSQTVGQSDAKGLMKLAEYSGDHFQTGIVIYDGADILPLGHERVFAVPISKLWEW